MKYTVCIEGLKEETKQQFYQWLEEMKDLPIQVIPHSFSKACIDIQLIEINHWFDWVRFARLKKYFRCYYIVLLYEGCIKTSPLAVKLGVQELLISPVKKSHFHRIVQDALYALIQHRVRQQRVEEKVITLINSTKIVPNDTLDEYVLRRFLHGDLSKQEEMLNALSLFHKNDFPNVVCFVQGFIFPGYEKLTSQEAIRFIYAAFQRHFRVRVPGLHFLRASRSLIVLFRMKETNEPIHLWQEGREAFQQIVQEMRRQHGIQLYIGVGSLYPQPEDLHHSFLEAKIARNKPPFMDVSLRYYEELPRSHDIIRATDYIEKNFTQPITAKEVAKFVNVSYSHFIRLFKKETGNTFTAYVSFIRLRQAVWLLRHTNKTIEEIADSTGFNTPNYFSTTFKKWLQLTPREFRATRYILFSADN